PWEKDSLVKPSISQEMPRYFKFFSGTNPSGRGGNACSGASVQPLQPVSTHPRPSGRGKPPLPRFRPPPGRFQPTPDLRAGGNADRTVSTRFLNRFNPPPTFGPGETQDVRMHDAPPHSFNPPPTFGPGETWVPSTSASPKQVSTHPRPSGRG